MVEVLVEHGADFTLTDADGNNAVQLASSLDFHR